MSHQDRKSKTRIVVNHESLKQAVNELFTTKTFRRVQARKGSKWTARMLVTVALFWAWSGCTGLKERFQQAAKVAGKILRWLPDPGRTYQGFIKQLQKWHGELQQACASELRALMKQDLFGQWDIAGFVVIAGDGSRVELPRTRSNEAVYSPKRKQERPKNKRKTPKKRNRRGRTVSKRTKTRKRQSAPSIAKKANSPQMWLTLFWHVGTGLPWAWRTGPSGSSERQHLQDMLAELPENTLIVADAGFMGYEFWRAVMEAGYRFVIRAGANVRLLKKLGYAREYDQTIYSLAQGRRQKGTAAFGAACRVGSRWKTADVLGDQRAEQDASERSADRGHLQSALGRGAVLQNFQANFRATQAPQPCGKERPVGNRLVVAGAMECLSVGTARTGSSRQGAASTESRGCDQGDSASDASLPRPAGLPRRNPLGDASLRAARRLPKTFIEDSSQLSEEKETRANRSSQSHRRIQITNCCGTGT